MSGHERLTSTPPWLLRVLIWSVIAVLGLIGLQAQAIWQAHQQTLRLQADLQRAQADTHAQRSEFEALRARLADAPPSRTGRLDAWLPSMALDVVDRARRLGLEVRQRAFISAAGRPVAGDASTPRTLAVTDPRTGLAAARLALDLTLTNHDALRRWFALLSALPVRIEQWRLDGENIHVELTLYADAGDGA